jgi:hypothetical protein
MLEFLRRFERKAPKVYGEGPLSATADSMDAGGQGFTETVELGA